MKCEFIKHNGQKCQAHCITGSRFCFSHDPSLKEEKEIAVKKGGLAPKKLYLNNEDELVLEDAGDAKRFLARVISGVWQGEIPATPIANTLGFLIRCYLDAIEKADIEIRLDAVEQKLREK